MKFFYIRDLSTQQPVGCVAYRLVNENPHDDMVNVKIAVEFQYSTHNPRDKFSKAIARQVAAGRLEKQTPYFVKGEELTNYSIKLAILSMLELEANNARLRKAAKKFLDWTVGGDVWLEAEIGSRER